MGAVLLLALSPLLLLLLSFPLKAEGEFRENKPKGVLRYLFLKIRFPAEKKKEKKPGKEKSRKNEQKKKKEKSRKTSGKAEKKKLDFPVLSLVTDAVIPALRTIFRHLQIRRLYIRGVCATGDACDTALLYGRINAIAGAVFAPISALPNLRKLRLELFCDFNAEKSVWELEGSISIRPIWLVKAVLSALWILLVDMIKKQAASGSASTQDNLTKGGKKKMSQSIEALMGTSMSKIKEMVDSNTVVGEPIKLSDTVTVIPISRVSFGFASGGADIPNKQDKTLFGGGAGAGVKMEPMAFLVKNGDDVQILPYTPAPVSSAERGIAMLPDLVEKISSLFSKKKEEPAEPETVSEENHD